MWMCVIVWTCVLFSCNVTTPVPCPLLDVGVASTGGGEHASSHGQGGHEGRAAGAERPLQLRLLPAQVPPRGCDQQLCKDRL